MPISCLLGDLNLFAQVGEGETESHRVWTKLADWPKFKWGVSGCRRLAFPGMNYGIEFNEMAFIFKRCNVPFHAISEGIRDHRQPFECQVNMVLLLRPLPWLSLTCDPLDLGSVGPFSNLTLCLAYKCMRDPHVWFTPVMEEVVQSVGEILVVQDGLQCSMEHMKWNKYSTCSPHALRLPC